MAKSSVKGDPAVAPNSAKQRARARWGSDEHIEAIANKKTPKKKRLDGDKKPLTPPDEVLDGKDDQARRAELLRPRPNKFFAKSGAFNVRTFAEFMERAGTFTTDHTGRLYHYRGGLYLPDGDRELADRARHMLDERFRMNYVSNTKAWFMAREPRITEDTIDTRYLNLPNGLLDWRTEELHPHTSDVMNLNRLPVEWDPDATCPTIDEWLAEALHEDCIELSHEMMGYALYNDLPFHVAGMLHGSGRNGKGTWLRLLRLLLGRWNVSAITPQALDDHRFAPAELYGKLANLTGDVDPKTFKVTERFKQATGQDLMFAERKNQQPFHFTNRAFIITSFNKFPRSLDTTEGFFSRWIVLPFDKLYLPNGVADPGVEYKLGDKAEIQGLLVHAVRGLQRLMARGGFAIPKSVEEATRTFRESADPMRSFVSERCQVGKRTARTEMRAAWGAWAMDNNYQPGSTRFFNEGFPVAASDVLQVKVEGGHGEKKYQGTQVFTNVELKPEEVRSKAVKTVVRGD